MHVRAASVVDLNVDAAHAAHTPSAVALGGCARYCPGLHVSTVCRLHVAAAASVWYDPDGQLPHLPSLTLDGDGFKN